MQMLNYGQKGKGQMIIKVIPQRLMRAADELRRSERRLTYSGYSIEETINSLKRSEDESMLVIAANLTYIFHIT